jgi:hypothetical protein
LRRKQFRSDQDAQVVTREKSCDHFPGWMAQPGRKGAETPLAWQRIATHPARQSSGRLVEPGMRHEGELLMRLCGCMIGLGFGIAIGILYTVAGKLLVILVGIVLGCVLGEILEWLLSKTPDFGRGRSLLAWIALMAWVVFIVGTIVCMQWLAASRLRQSGFPPRPSTPKIETPGEPSEP